MGKIYTPSAYQEVSSKEKILNETTLSHENFKLYINKSREDNFLTTWDNFEYLVKSSLSILAYLLYRIFHSTGKGKIKT